MTPTDARSSSSIWNQCPTSAPRQTLQKDCTGFQPTKEASCQPHYTAQAGTAFPLKYLAPKKALLTPSRQYVYDTILHTNTFFFFLSKRMVKKVVCLLSKRDCLRELLHSSMKWDMPAELRRGNLCCLSWTIWLSTHPGSLEKKVKINTK